MSNVVNTAILPAPARKCTNMEITQILSFKKRINSPADNLVIALLFIIIRTDCFFVLFFQSNCLSNDKHMLPLILLLLVLLFSLDFVVQVVIFHTKDHLRNRFERVMKQTRSDRLSDHNSTLPVCSNTSSTWRARGASHMKTNFLHFYLASISLLHPQCIFQKLTNVSISSYVSVNGWLF